MKKLSILLLAVLTIGCMPRRFVIYTDSPSPLTVKFNNSTRGTIEKHDTLLIESKRKAPLCISGKSDDLAGKIIYLPNPYGDFSIQKGTVSGDIEEISRGSVRTFNNGKTEIYSIKFRFSPDSGYLNLTSNEEGVDLYLDYNKIGAIHGAALNKKVEAGEHILMARKDHFIPITLKIDVRENEIYPIDFELKKDESWVRKASMRAITTQARGNLTIGTERSDYLVEVEGISIEAPCKLRDIPAGVYMLGVSCPDFKESIDVKVPVDSTTFVDLDRLFNR